MSDYIVIHGIKVHKDYANFVPETFGRLTTLGPKFLVPVGNRGEHKAIQVCRCSCGSSVVTTRTLLQTGKSKSCGCLQKEMAATANKKHGLRRSPEYTVWGGMLNRCRNATHDRYEVYGGRGIAVCFRWGNKETGFANFYSDMGPRPGPGYTIDRKEVDKGYYPENCEWVTNSQQQRNKRNNRMLTAFGKTQCMADWVDEIDISRSALKNRLNKGWPVEKALSCPPRSKHGKK